MTIEYWRWRARLAAKMISDGSVVAHPTEAVWGLACDPESEAAVQKILELKKRPVEKGLILLSADAGHFSLLTETLTQDERVRFDTPQDRPTTWLIPDENDQIPYFIKGRFTSVAVRVSDHPLVKEITSILGGPIVSTSANPAGQPPAKDLRKARTYFMGKVEGFINGPLGGVQDPSQIIDITSGTIVRA